MATATTSVKKAFDTQADLKDHREHCAPAARALASLGSGPRQQVRIHRNGEFALYTVSELLHETTDSVVRMGLGGRQRLQSEEEFEGLLDTKVVDPDLSDKEARDAGELVERLDDDGSQTHLIVIAPHGGDTGRAARRAVRGRRSEQHREPAQPVRRIQIEQGPSPRDDHGCNIADVVADLFRPTTALRETWARRVERVLARVWKAMKSLVDRVRNRHPD